MHRDLAFHRSKLAAPIELQGRTHKKAAPTSPTSQGRWEDFIGNSRDGFGSPKSVKNRVIESSNAHRTIHPELATDDVYHKTRKINAKETSSEPGNLMNLLRKSGTMDDVYGSRKKYFKEIEKTEALITPRADKRHVRPHERKMDDWCSQIPTLHSPTYVEKNSDNSPQSGFGSPKSPTGKLHQESLKSSIGILPCGEDTKRRYVDRDEYMINQSMHSPRTAKHMASTYLDEPLHPTTYKKDPNRMNHSTYESGNRLNPWTKGKKVEYPQYTEKNATSAVPDNGGVYSPRSGGFEPLDPLHVGRRSIPAQRVVNNIVTPPAEKNVPRGQAVYSYRTYTSQIF